MLFIPLSLHPTQSLIPCPWPLWMAQTVAKMHISRPNDPPGFFIPTPTPTKCIQSTPHTIPLHEYIIHSSLLSPHPISDPLSLTTLNGSNCCKNAYFLSQWPPWVFSYQPLPIPNVSSQLPTPSPHTKMSFIPLSFHPTQSLTPCPWPLWMAQTVAKMHISRPNDPPLVFFIPTPTPTKCIQSTPHTIPLHEYIIHSSLPSPHPISDPLSLTPLNGSNCCKNAHF